METSVRARVRAGDRNAFSELFGSYAKAVYSVAEDIMSASFLEAWRLRERVDPSGGSMRPWLLGIATNIARNHMRGNRRYRAAVSALAAMDTEAGDHADDVAGRVDDDRRAAAALSALGSLRRPEREVVILCLWEGLDYASVSQALDIPIGTVRSRLSRARARLRKSTLDALATGNLAGRSGQSTGDNTNAVRPTQEGQR